MPGPVVQGLKRSASVWSAERRANRHGGQRPGATQGPGGSEFELEPLGGGGTQLSQGTAASTVASTIGGSPGTGDYWDQQQHDPLAAEVVGQGGGERPPHKACGREQQAAQEWPVGRAGQQQVLVDTGTVGVGQLDGHAKGVG